MSSVKICTRCGFAKTLAEFDRSSRATGARAPRGGFGVEARCKTCKSIARDPTVIARRNESAAIAADGRKRCGTCQQCKPTSEFHKMRASHDGRAFKCKECVNTYSAQWRERNPDAAKQWHRKNKDHKSAYTKKYREENKARVTASYAQWAKANPDKVNALIAKRTAQKRQAMPDWANQFFMREAYALAKLRERVIGGKWHVDHIVPLQNEIVCGLHVETNMRVIPAFENQSKSNRHWPDMPC